MKRLMAMGLSVLLALGSGAALADRDHRDHRGRHGSWHGEKHHYKHYKHYRKHHKRYHRKHRPSHRVYYYPRYSDRHHYYPLGAALLGSAVTYSLYHSHNGERCYDNHPVSSHSTFSPESRVIGCHRIERYPDGSERRVDLPVSECY